MSNNHCPREKLWCQHQPTESCLPLLSSSCMPPCAICPRPCQLLVVTLRRALPHLLTQSANPPVLSWPASACLHCSPLFPCEATPLLTHTFFIQHTSSPQLHRSLSPSMFLTPCCQVSNPSAAASTQFSFTETLSSSCLFYT